MLRHTPDTERIRPAPAHERGPRGSANRLLAEVAREHRAAGRKPVKVRRLRHWISVATEAVIEVVEDHEDDVGLLLGRVGGMKHRKRRE